MTSLLQIEANRRNALRSTGPRTEGGRQVCSRNALRHGLTGSRIVLFDEDQEQFERFYSDIIDALKPQGPMEIQLAERMRSMPGVFAAPTVSKAVCSSVLVPLGGKDRPSRPPISISSSSASVSQHQRWRRTLQALALRSRHR